MKITLLSCFISVLMCSNLLSAEEKPDLIERIYREVPDASAFEKHCILTAYSDVELEHCLDSQPDTELYRYEQSRRHQYKDIFQRLVWDKEPAEERDPWYTFCVHHSTLLCFEYCLNGWVCPDD